VLHAEKLRNLILAIAVHPSVKSLGLTKLWKLIYFVDVAALREHGSTITGSEFVKYQHGPVPSRGEKILKSMKREALIATEQRVNAGYAQTSVVALAQPDTSVFSSEERAIIERVCAELGRKTAKALSDLSHDEPAWALANNLDKLDPELMHYGGAEDPEGL
jgi:uncharacterized phage-associated protein